jgi:hypothetical protein
VQQVRPSKKNRVIITRRAPSGAQSSDNRSPAKSTTRAVARSLTRVLQEARSASGEF